MYLSVFDHDDFATDFKDEIKKPCGTKAFLLTSEGAFPYPIKMGIVYPIVIRNYPQSNH